MAKHKFAAELVPLGAAGSWSCVRVPFDARSVFGSRARVAVRGTINGFAFRSSIFPEGDGTFFLMVNKEMRAGAGIGIGDVARVVIERDDAPRTIEPPDDLRRALARDRGAKARFEQLAYSHRKEFIDWIQEAKRPETRARRIESALAMLREGARPKG